MNEFDELKVMCCFCFQEVKNNVVDPVTLVVYPAWKLADEGGEGQGLYCHGACLRKAVHPSAPLLTEIGPS